MAKAALLMDMIELLRARPGITVDELSTNLGRSSRTIYRWLSELTSDIGVSVLSTGGGYFLEEGSDPQNHHLSAEELLAVHTAIRSLSISDVSPLRTQMQSAWLKIKDCASGRALEFSNQLACGYDIRFTVTQGSIDPGIPRTIEKAIGQRKRLKIVYRSQKSNRVKNYVIDPYVLVFRRHSWYLMAHSHEHDKVVMFKLLRFREAYLTDEDFNVPESFSVQDYFKYSWEARAGDEPTIVRVRFSPAVAEMVGEARRHHTQVVYPQDDGGIIFEATVAGYEEIAIWILGFGKEAEVLEPLVLRDLIRTHAAAMTVIYGGPPALMQGDISALHSPDAALPECVASDLPEEV